MSTKLPYVFISYSSKNTAKANTVRNILNRNGLQSWMAPHDVPAGAKYAHVIDEAIENCAGILLLLTEEAQESDHVDREIERAISYKKKIIPMRLDGCSLNSGFRYYLGSCQIADVAVLNEANAEMQAIIQSVIQITDVETDAFRAFLGELSRWQSLPRKYVAIPERMELLENIYGRIIALLKEEGYEDDEYKITVEHDPLGVGDASISFESDDISLSNIKEFCEIIQNFANFEIYPLLNGKLRFSGVFKKVARVITAEKTE